MTLVPGDADALSRWLDGPARAVLDALTGEAPDLIGVIDRDLTLRYINRTAPGLSREEVLGQSVLALAPPQYRELARHHYSKVLASGRASRFEMAYGNGDGDRVRMWDVRIGPIRFEGAIIGMIAVTSDVAEERRAEADRIRFFSLSLDMLVVASPSGHFKRVNPAFGEILGYDAAALVGTPLIDLVHADDRAQTLEAFTDVVRGTPVTDFVNRYRRADGEYRVFSWRATVDPVTRDAYAVARDITDQRAMEVQLRHAQKMEAVGQLAGGVAHDFNNLMQAILGNTGLAKMEHSQLSPGVAERIREIEEAAHRAGDLTKQLLAFGRRQTLLPVLVDLNALVVGLTKMLRRLLPESITIDLIPGHKLASVNADPGQLEQVIVNLAVNARDAMERGGRLTIETENVLVNGRYRDTHPWAKPGRYVLLSMTDTGVGMMPEVRERIFEPFFTTKGPQQGTGLGLATVYGIVQQHGGMIHVYSEPGMGTTFKVYLPADLRMAADVGSKVEALPPRGQETILVVEDEEAVRRAVLQVLQHAGYRTLEARHGIEALRLLREHDEPVQLALLDVVTPEMGGPETWEQIQSLRAGMRVIFASGYAGGQYTERLPKGAEVLQKPFSIERLLERIRAKLDE